MELDPKQLKKLALALDVQVGKLQSTSDTEWAAVLRARTTKSVVLKTVEAQYRSTLEQKKKVERARRLLSSTLQFMEMYKSLMT
jgi:hypothetical protein